MTKLRNIVAAVLLTSSSLLLPAAAQETELRFSHFGSPVHVLSTKGFDPWAASLAAASEGKLKVTTYPAQQLGAAVDHYNMAAQGIADVALVNPGYQPGRFPLAALGDIPFLISDAIEATPALFEWYSEVSKQEMADVEFCLAFFNPVGSLTAKEEIILPEQLSGVTVRAANVAVAEFVTAMGGTTVQVPPTEIREILARGVADAVTIQADTLYSFGIADVTSFHLNIPLYSTVSVIVLNKTSYEQLGSEARAAVDAHCTAEWGQKIVQGWVDATHEASVRLASEAKMKVHTPSKEELGSWIKAAAPLGTRWIDSVTAAGKNGAALHADLMLKLNARNASFDAGE